MRSGRCLILYGLNVPPAIQYCWKVHLYAECTSAYFDPESLEGGKPKEEYHFSSLSPVCMEMHQHSSHCINLNIKCRDFSFLVSFHRVGGSYENISVSNFAGSGQRVRATPASINFVS